MDRKACKESTDAMLAYGLGFLAAIRRLQWPPGGSVTRLPAGGPCCAYHGNDNHQVTACNLPEEAPCRASRPVCVVFDELDPIAALERSFEFSTTSTQTIFVEHKSSQTDEQECDRAARLRSSDVKQNCDRSTQYEQEENSNESESDNSDKKKKQKEAYPAPPYYPTTRLTKEAYIAPKQQNVLQKVMHWKQSFLDGPKVDSQTAVSSQRVKKKERAVLPEIYEKLNELHMKVDKQTEQIRHLQKDLDGMLHQHGTFEKNSIYATKKTPFQQPATTIKVCDESSWEPSTSNKSNISPALGGPRQNANASAGKRSSKVEFAAQPNSNYLLQKKCSSECQLCAEQQQPVLDDLIDKVLQLIGNRMFEEVVITVLLRADNVYHVNVRERQSRRNLGCVLATHGAIEKAARQGFFKQFLTYTVTDVRNTITSPTHTFGIPFEFVPPEEKSKCQTDDEDDDDKSTNLAVCEFITKVLRMPADNIKQP